MREGDRAVSNDSCLIRGAYVMTMDPALGDRPGADILIREGRIVDVGPSIAAGDAEIAAAGDMIALPGFVDTHWHLWNSALRGLYDYHHPDFNYFPLTMRLGPLLTPGDAYCNVRLAVAEGLLSGITTVNDWAHNVMSPAHADAELTALKDCGVRARFSYGWPQNLSTERTMDIADVARVQSQWFASDGLMHLGVALRTPVAYQRGNVAIDALKQDHAAARALGLPVTMHNRQGTVTMLEQHGMLDEHLLLVHPQIFSADEIELLARRKVKISCAPVLENAKGINGPRGPIQFSELTAAGVPWSLSVDETATNGRADFFAVMREMIRSDWQRAGDHTKVTARRILELATREGAAALGLSHVTGTLTPGKRADIVLMRRTDINMSPTIGDPSSMIVFSGQTNNVDTVFVDGRCLVRGGRPKQLNLDEIARAALASTVALSERDPARRQAP
jgi:cytosine/adenosine deaminase-related metal-dependent hydrolase